jgi:hypothetical protein
MGRSHLKLLNQRHQMRKRELKALEHQQSLNKYYHLYSQEKHRLQELRSDRVHRDNVSADVRTPAFLTQSIRLRNLEAKIQYTQQQLERIRALDHYN